MVRKLKNASGKSGNQQDIIKQAQVMQQEMLKIQEGLKDKFVETSVAGGGITLKANGQKKIVDLSISLDVNIECIAEDLSHAVTPNELKQQLGYYGLSSIYHIDGVYYFTTLL